jgi:hypothetical protein
METNAADARERLWRSIAKFPYSPDAAFTDLFGPVDEDLPDRPARPVPTPARGRISKELLTAPLISSAGRPIFALAVHQAPTLSYDRSTAQLTLAPKEFLRCPPTTATAADSPIAWVKDTAYGIPIYTFNASGKLVLSKT